MTTAARRCTQRRRRSRADVVAFLLLNGAVLDDEAMH